MGASNETKAKGLKLKAENLVNIPLFAGVAPERLTDKKDGQGRTLLEQIMLRDYEPGETILKEGEFGADIFYIISGEVSVLIRALKDSPETRLGRGEIFGEVSAINHYPRSATVLAGENCTVLTFGRTVLELLLRRSPTLKKSMDALYKERLLESHLKSADLLKDVPREQIQELMEAAEFRTYKKGQVIFKQGEIADAFYMIRNGFVKISQSLQGARKILDYKTSGDYLGQSFLNGAAHPVDAEAMDHVDLTLIPAAAFLRVLERRPELLERILDTKLSEARRVEERGQSTRESQFLDFAVESGLVYGEDVLLIDRDICVGCDDCYRACADIHGGYSRLVREGPVFENYQIVTSCRACADPVCMLGCPTGAIHRGSRGEIKIESNCIGCSNCVNQCPFDNIVITKREGKGETENVAAKCDQCVDRAVAACEYNCSYDAIKRVSPRDFFDTLHSKGAKS